jgi:uncharacterized protein YjbI with pentapeptide repeats
VSEAVRTQTSPVGELLDGAILRGLELKDELSLGRVGLRNADMSEVDLSHATLRGTKLGNTELRAADLTDANLKDAILTDVDLRDSTLSDAQLSKADLSDATLWDADLRGAELRSVNLTDAQLQGADVSNAELPGSDLPNAQLRYANLTRADFSDATLQNTNLTDAKLSNANLSNANLQNANLTEADMTEADFRDANLSNVNVESAKLLGTNLFDANLSGIRPYGARFTGAQINDGTELDADSSEDTRWWHRGPLSPKPRCAYDPTREAVSAEDTEERLTKAADTYKQFEDLARDNTRPVLQSSMFTLRQDMLRKRYRLRRELSRYLFAVISGGGFRYGESLLRIFAWGILFVFGYAVVYEHYNLIVTADGGPVTSFVDALYFSTLTFTTLGLGDFKPEPMLQSARLLVTSQAAVGAIMIAIFVFVLGRRAAR